MLSAPYFTILSITMILYVLQLQQYPQQAQAFPCVGGTTKEYCTGYHDGAIQAKKDYKIGHDLNVDQYGCTHNITDYCDGYNRGYSDEADILG